VRRGSWPVVTSPTHPNLGEIRSHGVGSAPIPGRGSQLLDRVRAILDEYQKNYHEFIPEYSRGDLRFAVFVVFWGLRCLVDGVEGGGSPFPHTAIEMTMRRIDWTMIAATLMSRLRQVPSAVGPALAAARWRRCRRCHSGDFPRALLNTRIRLFSGWRWSPPLSARPG